MELVKAYGINIKYNNALGFERLVTFDSYDIAREAYQTILCSQEAKQFALEYIPTPEEFSTHTMVELYYKLEDIKTILDEYFDGATIDDLSDDEINAIMDIYDEYLVERTAVGADKPTDELGM